METEETKESTEVEEKKQVKFSENSKQTTYEKDQDGPNTTDDDEGAKSTENVNVGGGTSKQEDEEIIPTKTETDEEKLERLGKKYELNVDEPNYGVDLKTDSRDLNEKATEEILTEEKEVKTNRIPEDTDKQVVVTDTDKNDKADKEVNAADDDKAKDSENSDTESKKETKTYQPPSMSYSLGSRGNQPQNNTADESTDKNKLQVSPDNDNTATPRDVELTEGQQSDRKDDNKPADVHTANKTDEAKEAEHVKPSKKEEQTEKNEEKVKTENEPQTPKDSANVANEDKDKPNNEESNAKPTPVKPNVKLDLSNNTNNNSAQQRSNDRNSAHIKTDFRKGRPVQTTATKITVPTSSSEPATTNKPSTTQQNRSTTQQNKPATQQSRPGTTKDSMSPRELAAQQRAERQKKAQSARPAGRGSETARSVTSGTSSRSSRPPSRPRSCGYDSERRVKEFFQAELKRLKQSLGNEAKKFKRPKPRDHYPFVYVPLDPYCNTSEATFLINMPTVGYKEKQPPEMSKSMQKKEVKEQQEEDELMFTTRSTAIGLTDPWDSYNMDQNILPKLETAELRQKRMDQMRATPKPKNRYFVSRTMSDASPRTKRPEAKQGSTRLPKFPVITSPNQDLTKKELYYGDVPMLRDELNRNYSHNGEERKKTDYNRTKQDFFRMELDRVNDYHRLSRPHMRAAYFAYLQNTPGSRKALVDCMKEIKQKKEEQPPQAVA